MQPHKCNLRWVIGLCVLSFSGMGIVGYAKPIHCLMWSPTQMMAKLALTKEVTLENSPDIYFKVAEFVQDQGLLQSEEAGRG